MTAVSVVIPTVGRPSLARLFRALAGAGPAALPAALPAAQLLVEVLVVDDRPPPQPPLALPPVPGVPVRVLPGRAAGPAAARNTGWRSARHPWVVFLDDDVVPEPDWWHRLAADLAVPAGVGGVQGRVRVPLPADRRPTDWERCTAGLAGAPWITADMAYRRAALVGVCGFDERFPRAYREDTECAHRVTRAGWRLTRGRRQVTHPVRPEGPWVSLHTQRGNADDALLRHLYGRRWRDVLGLARGRRPRHLAVTAAGALALLAALTRHRRVAAAAAVAWLAGTGELVAGRLRNGPASAPEVSTVAVTSAAMPPVATAHWLRGWWRHRGARPVTGHG